MPLSAIQQPPEKGCGLERKVEISWKRKVHRKMTRKDVRPPFPETQRLKEPRQRNKVPRSQQSVSTLVSLRRDP